MRALRHLFLMWTGLASDAERRYFVGPPKAPQKVYEERVRGEENRVTVTRDQLAEALEMSHDTPIPEFTKALLEKDWVAHQRENIEGFGRLYQG